jgi:two-component system CheB/CheR fusion protein
MDEYFPIVGIGASAGGLAAFEAFFSGMPANVDPGMAFVLVQHLAPDHSSILTELIRRYTPMQVFEVEDGMTVKPNCAYIIPPNRDMAFLNGTLQLMDPSAPRGHRLPVDFFFRSLAHDQRERAIGIVLSGTGSDGTQGVRAIKGEGGLAMAQTPESAEYDGMPRSAIATGDVDHVLAPSEMAIQLISYAAQTFGNYMKPKTALLPDTQNALKKIFVILRAQTGHDFSQYKLSTVQRRIDRRMAVYQIDTIGRYLKHLQVTPTEVEALFRDLLIGVTNFFRDPEAFQILEEQFIPKLFAEKPAGAVIRVWSPGCSTGEEAYSLAILLVEGMEAVKKNYTIQVFATDIDSQAIATARVGLYPAGIAADVSPERLARFFTVEGDGSAYRIHKGLRDLLVFSEHDVIKDPPFSKLDLISCRNLMIYLGGDLQKKLIRLFHYALNPAGLLFLGTSETVGDASNLFTALDRKAKLYQRKNDFLAASRTAVDRFLPPMTPMVAATLTRAGAKTTFPVKLPLRELAEQTLLQQLAPASAIVNGQGDILYLHGRTGMYLEPATGEVSNYNILKMAREGLRRDLATALNKAIGANEPVRCPGLRVKTNGHFTTVNLSICQVLADPAAIHESPLYLVILEEAPPPEQEPARPGVLPSSAGAVSPESQADLKLHVLAQELRAKEEYLRSATEELETSNEELKSSNEEMQSVNEELQSTNEEMETSKEELQSINEELATVNSELSIKLVDLSRANNDMNNLLSGTGIATIFVDLQLRILRFTPTASAIINLIPGDVGRPAGHIVYNLVGYTSLMADAQSVLDTLIPKELEVQTSDGKCFTMRIQPYRTLDNVIEGAVITFVDITEMKRVASALQESKLIIEKYLNIAAEIIVSLDDQGTVKLLNDSGHQSLGYAPNELIGKNWIDLCVPAASRAEARRRLERVRNGEAVSIESGEDDVLTKQGARRTVFWHHAILRDVDNRFIGTLSSGEDFTEFNRVKEVAAQSQAMMSRLEGFTHIGSWEWEVATDTVRWSNELFRILQRNPADGPLSFARHGEIYPPEDLAQLQQAVAVALQEGVPYELKVHALRSQGEVRLCLARGFPQQGADGRVQRLFGTLEDITERKETEEALRQAHDLLRLAAVVRDAHDAITVQDLEGRTIAWNPGAVRMYGWSEAEALAMNVRDRIPKGLRKAALARLRQLSRAEILEPYLTQRITKAGKVLEVSMISTALVDEAGHIYAIATTERPREGGPG